MVFNNNTVQIIAEAGVNHNGDLKVALKMVEVAAKSGADFIKFQTFKVEDSVSRNSEKAAYQVRNTGKDESQFEMLKKLEIDHEAHRLIMNHCAEHKIGFLSTPFDLGSIHLLHQLGLKTVKIPSGEIINLPYLRKIGRLDWDIILSTGMASLGEIERALEILAEAGKPKEKITVLHCNTEYPTPYEDVNLRAMKTIGRAFGVKTGYSDHTPGIVVPIAAVALGACVIEKHFTLDRNMDGPDHVASLEPGELEEMVVAIRRTEQALGSAIKQPSPSERKNIAIARKSVHTARPLSKNAVISESDLICKRPGNGISPMAFDDLVGKRLKSDLPGDYMLRYEDLL
ncbi:MAG TPA: N-acetylneuraminate synthase [Calditrichia bacterium]|nr:N-acetylneuraminate synthase [Calditrichota bacterium]HQU74145.1 N-acetylneuraminate synthase [Calditrichia bacterium]HQV32162.1 N-acetylneuraminate synthase [Calditrichia bacterium]